MSADSWSICPRCRLRHEANAKRLIAEANAAYGTLEVTAWKALDAEARAAGAPYAETDLREDYELSGADEGEVTVSYSCFCQKCALASDFRHSHTIEGLFA